MLKRGMTMMDMRKPKAIRSSFRTRTTGKQLRIEGYFAVFNQNYELWKGATESIDRHAFDGCLNDDIRCLVDHNTRLVLGRTKAGTLTLRVDDHGLWGSVLINTDDQDAVNVYRRIQRGDINQCSFGFEILDEDLTKKPNGDVHWTIKKVKLYEVSCVTFPAYVGTSIEARKKDLAAYNSKPAAKKKQSIEEFKREMYRRLRAASKKLHERTVRS